MMKRLGRRRPPGSHEVTRAADRAAACAGFMGPDGSTLPGLGSEPIQCKGPALGPRVHQRGHAAALEGSTAR